MNDYLFSVCLTIPSLPLPTRVRQYAHCVFNSPVLPFRPRPDRGVIPARFRRFESGALWVEP